MAYVSIVADIPGRTIGSLRKDCDRTSKQESMRQLLTELQGVLGGTRKGHVRASLGSVRSSTTIGCDVSDAVDGTDDVTIAGVTFSVVASPDSSGEEIDGGTTDLEFATNLAAAINAHATLSKIVFAVSDGVDTVTVYSIYPGPVGDLILLTETGNGFTLGAANLENGASDETDAYAFGYDPANA